MTKTINLKPIVNNTLSVISLVLLAGFAYQGVVSLVDARPWIQTGVGILLILLLIKTAVKK